MTTSAPVGTREAKRRETRSRLFDAALAEIALRGLAAADVTAIATAVGVVRGTFYFHFPTKEHVLVELERNEEILIASQLSTDGDLETMLTDLVHCVVDAERRLGAVVFRDMLGLHFSSARPVEDEPARHPLARFLVDAITRAQQRGGAASGVAPEESAAIFLTGLFALLATGVADTRMLECYVTTMVKGLETR